MWNNQGNGNGQGNGYGNPQANDVYDRLNNAKQLTNRDPYIEPGTHTLAVVSLEEFRHDTGQAVRGTFLVLDSTSMKPDTKCAEVWFLQKPAPKVGMTTDSDRFADFCTRLKGAPAGHPIGADIRVLLRDRANEQLARGMVIRCVAIIKKAQSTGKPFNLKNWSNLEQTPQQIAEMRQKIEMTPGIAEQAKPQQAVGYALQQQVAPNGYGAQPAQGLDARPQPQAVPLGGFLANVPPQGNGNGSNGGW